MARDTTLCARKQPFYTSAREAASSWQ